MKKLKQSNVYSISERKKEKELKKYTTVQPIIPLSPEAKKSFFERLKNE